MVKGNQSYIICNLAHLLAHDQPLNDRGCLVFAPGSSQHYQQLSTSNSRLKRGNFAHGLVARFSKSKGMKTCLNIYQMRP